MSGRERLYGVGIIWIGFTVILTGSNIADNTVNLIILGIVAMTATLAVAVGSDSSSAKTSSEKAKGVDRKRLERLAALMDADELESLEDQLLARADEEQIRHKR